MKNSTDGLTAAMQRQVAMYRGAAGLAPISADLHALNEELRSDAGDGPRLSLAKAVARMCLRLRGVEHSMRAIDYVDYVRALERGDATAARKR